jgi:uncharacterized protein YecE (DUF72 family)
MEDRTMNFYIGTSGYSYPEWKGNFYPEKMSPKKMLGFYAERFRTVEINHTFRIPPTTTVLESWAAQVPADFRFVLKAPQTITHRKRLRDVNELVASFVETAGTLKERLGALLFQLPPNFKKDAARLRDFLSLLPAECRAVMEFRHPSWFDDEVFDLLREHRVGLCIADAGDDLDVPLIATADWGYLRLRCPDYDDAMLKTWAKRMRAQDWSDCFVFFKHEDSGKGPQLAARLVDVLARSSRPALKRKRAG